LLEGHFRAQGFLTQTAESEPGPELPQATVTLASEASPATVIGRYKLLEKIGEGGFGEVWMAEQREPIKRRVALKIIKLGMDTKQVVARFEAERQALAMMDHPNIAKIFDAGVTEGRARHSVRAGDAESHNLEFDFEAGRNPVAEFFSQNPALLREPTRRERLEAETELFGYAVSGHPLELFNDVAWDTYCPVARLGEHVGETVVTCGLVVEQRTHHQITGEPMKFLTLADWTGMVETELFAQTYKSYGLATVRYPVLEITAMVEPFDNGRGFSLRVLRAGKPRR
jgi:DNA polymerase III alpha subunit